MNKREMKYKSLYNKLKIKVNFATYVVHYAPIQQVSDQFNASQQIKSTDQYAGYCDYIKKEIGLCTDMIPAQQWSVFCHELGHAVDHEYHTVRSIEETAEMVAEFAAVFANVMDYNNIRRK